MTTSCSATSSRAGAARAAARGDRGGGRRASRRRCARGELTPTPDSCSPNGTCRYPGICWAERSMRGSRRADARDRAPHAASCCSTPAPAAARPRCSSSASPGPSQEDGIEVGQILTITFTEKAAAELRERIRARLRAVGRRRGGARDRGRLDLDDPRLLRAAAAHPRAGRRSRPGVHGARRARGRRAASGAASTRR